MGIIKAVYLLVSELDRQLKAAQRNLAIEENPEYRQAIREEFDRIRTELAKGEAQLAAVSLEPIRGLRTPEQEVEAAMRLLDDIRQVASDPSPNPATGPSAEAPHRVAVRRRDQRQETPRPAPGRWLVGLRRHSASLRRP